MSRDKAYLTDILEAAQAIRRFVDGVTPEAFQANEEKYEAVNRKFEIIGEAARRLSPEALQEFPDIPWKLVTAMRNILIHDYDDVDLDVVWRTAQNDLPALIARLEAYLSTLPPEPADTAKPTPLDWICPIIHAVRPSSPRTPPGPPARRPTPASAVSSASRRTRQ